jgi:hypothetical protein
MDKRTFIKLCATAVASPSVGRMLAWAGQERLRNWAGNLEHSAHRVYNSTSIEQVQERVKTSNKLKVLGTRHRFNNIADSKDAFVSLKSTDKVIALDKGKRTVTVSAGITYGPMDNYAHIWTTRGLRCTTSHRCLIFPCRAHAALRPMARVKRMGTWRPQYLDSKWSRRTAQ